MLRCVLDKVGKAWFLSSQMHGRAKNRGFSWSDMKRKQSSMSVISALGRLCLVWSTHRSLKSTITRHLNAYATEKSWGINVLKREFAPDVSQFTCRYVCWSYQAHCKPDPLRWKRTRVLLDCKAKWFGYSWGPWACLSSGSIVVQLLLF